MSETNIHPEKITKPIQLLAAWLLGLIAIESSLLTADGTITKPEWLSVLFGISAVCIIPLFLILIFLLQTKYRPQIQEDEYYSKYLDKNTMSFVDVSLNKNIPLEQIKNELKQFVTETQENLLSIKETINKGESKESLASLISVSDMKIAELEKFVKYINVNMHINKKLATFPEIIKSIKKLGFNQYEEFGEEPIPKSFLISFAKTVSPLILRDLLLELIPLGASYLNYIAEEEDNIFKYGNAIFIGSYLYNEKGNVTIDQSILNKLTSLTKDSNISDLLMK